LRDRRESDQDLYRGLNLSDDEGDWVRHYLRVADQVLFGRRPAPRVVVVEDEWQMKPRSASLAPKDRVA
jgi:hypothetical protein